jgi:hypothetical protein
MTAAIPLYLAVILVAAYYFDVRTPYFVSLTDSVQCSKGELIRSAPRKRIWIELKRGGWCGRKGCCTFFIQEFRFEAKLSFCLLAPVLAAAAFGSPCTSEQRARAAL